MISDCTPILHLGLIVATPQAIDVLRQAEQKASEFLNRHAYGDWGEVSKADRNLNDRAIREGERVISAYRTRNDHRLWIITEADRSCTTLLLPEEY